MSKRIISWFLFILVFITETIAGYYVWHIKGFVFGDGISRVANAFYVLYIRPPHLAAIGAIWTPLPSMLELPILLLWPFYKPLASSGLAGVIMNALCMGGCAALLYVYTIKYGRSHFTGICLALFFCFNPFIFIYGFSGLAEAPFFLVLIWLVYSYTQWMETEEPVYVVYMAIALALGFLIRYEAIPIVGFLSLGVLLMIFMVHRKNLEPEHRNFKYSLIRSEGTAYLLLSPVVYVCLLWILYCWIINGNPLYFLNSNYSNLYNQQEFAKSEILGPMIGNVGKTLQYIFLCSKYFLIPLVAILLYRLIKFRLFKWDLLTLFLLLISTLALQFYMLLHSASNGTFRYFCNPFPMLCAWLPYEMKKVNSKIFTSLCLISLIIANVFLGYAWFQKQEFKNRVPTEVPDLKFECAQSEQTQKNIGKYINTHLPNARILMDSFRTYNVILNVNKPSNLVITSSYIFKKVVGYPWRYKIDYIIVPIESNDNHKQDAVNTVWPDLYKRGAPWCTLVKEFDGFYKLYRVHKNPIIKKPVIKEQSVKKVPVSYGKKILYKVKVGPYAERNMALTDSYRLKDLGYPVYVASKAPYTIQVGVFAEKEYAEIMKQKLKSDGYEGFILSE
jgi:hypothetical protein